MKFTREYMFGGNKKATDEDYIVAYIAENGMRIRREFSGNNDKNCWYVFGGEVYDTLKEAKVAVETSALEAPAAPANEPEAADVPETEPAANVTETASETAREPVKFEVGREYKCAHCDGVSVRIAERTENTVAYVGNWSGCHVSRALIHVKRGIECICTDIHGVFAATDEVTVTETVSETATEQAAAKTYAVSFIVGGIFCANMAIAESAEAVEAYYTREYSGRGEVYAVREAEECEITENRRRGTPFVTVPSEPVSEPETADEAANATDTATDNKAAAMTAQEITARELYVRAYELRLRAENLNNEGKLHDGFVRSVERLEHAAYRAAAHESAMRAAAKNPRVAAAMERLRAKQAATETTDEPATDKEPRMTLEDIYAATLHDLDANGGDIVGVAVYTDSGDTVEEYNDVMDVINRYGNRKVEPVYIGGDEPTSMTEPDAHGVIHVALVGVNTATNEGRKAFRAENARLAAKAAPHGADATPEGVPDSAEPETVELHDDIDTYAVCEKNGIAWTRVNTNTLAIRADDYQMLLDSAKNKRYIRNLRRDSNTGRFCGGAFTLAGTIAG